MRFHAIRAELSRPQLCHLISRESSVSECERRLLSLAVNADAALASLVRSPLDADDHVGLDAKTRALVCLGAVIVSGASPVTYQWATQVALDAGATDAEIVGTLAAVAPVSGLTRAVSAAPELAVTLGYDIDEALEGGANLPGRGD